MAAGEGSILAGPVGTVALMFNGGEGSSQSSQGWQRITPGVRAVKRNWFQEKRVRHPSGSSASLANPGSRPRPTRRVTTLRSCRRYSV
jgi:hypothetical protein